MKRNKNLKFYESNFSFKVKEMIIQVEEVMKLLNENDSIYKVHKAHLDNLNRILNLSSYVPRFDWCAIQYEMDKLFNIDSTIMGFRLNIDFKESILKKRAYIKCLFSNNKFIIK